MRGFKNLLGPLIFQTPILGIMKQISAESENLHEISCMLRAIDYNHYPDTTLNIGLTSHYCKKNSIQFLLQDVVNCQCKF